MNNLKHLYKLQRGDKRLLQSFDWATILNAQSSRDHVSIFENLEAVFKKENLRMNEVFRKLFDLIDKGTQDNGDGILEVHELEKATKNPKIKEITNKYVVKHSSEWDKTQNMVDVLQNIVDNIDNSEFENKDKYIEMLKKEKIRIENLSFFSECKSISDFPQSDMVYVINPIGLVNEFKSSIDVDGYVYSYDGVYLGVNEKREDTVYIAERFENGNFINVKKIENITHREFQICSQIVKHEGTHITDENEYIWIAHTANNYAKRKAKTLYQVLMTGYSSVSSTEKIPLPDINDDSRSNFARKGILDIYITNNDPTNGATKWDGTDFLAWGLNSPYGGKPQAKFREFSKITIESSIYEDYKSAQLVKYAQGRVRYSRVYYTIPDNVFTNPNNWETGNFEYITYAKDRNGNLITIKLVATGTKGNTIFWKELE
ncbi:hypothetical protein CKA56_03825 [Arcobacter venerupis]|uniref:hypothetical protein n=1 Tax=Arcobacter venerupis TaxID=1054033 RepID=UPI000FEBBF5F|nr:hypothetical protein [Arcobacter venerupis]RWS50671.1 hypothetical protein CKA56_03825 [Arcobacter venerupis]